MAQASDLRLPAPGMMVHLSLPFDPPMIKGIKVHPDNPLDFDFILDKGDSVLSNDQLKNESTKLIKYFLASLTIPEKDLWVNLSPYEKDRIIPNSFGLTEMGRDLLAEDYMLKQITASLIYPEGEIGKKFWKRIYQEAQKKYGTTDIAVNTFNKVWIVPEKAVVYENAKAGTAYVVESKLNVMLDQDYLSLEKHSNVLPLAVRNDVASIGANIVREIVIPELTKEVNGNKNFGQLRQVYNSLILATWYKKKIKDSILNQVYADKYKVLGVNIDDPKEKERIYRRYLKAFKKGVYNYIKEVADPVTQEGLPRKYFSGGFSFANRLNKVFKVSTDIAMVPKSIKRLANIALLGVSLFVASQITDDRVGKVFGSNATEVVPKGIEFSQHLTEIVKQIFIEQRLNLKERKSLVILKQKDISVEISSISDLGLDDDMFYILSSHSSYPLITIVTDHQGNLKELTGAYINKKENLAYAFDGINLPLIVELEKSLHLPKVTKLMREEYSGQWPDPFERDIFAIGPGIEKHDYFMKYFLILGGIVSATLMSLLIYWWKKSSYLNLRKIITDKGFNREALENMNVDSFASFWGRNPAGKVLKLLEKSDDYRTHQEIVSHLSQALKLNSQSIVDYYIGLLERINAQIIADQQSLLTFSERQKLFPFAFRKKLQWIVVKQIDQYGLPVVSPRYKRVFDGLLDIFLNSHDPNIQGSAFLGLEKISKGNISLSGKLFAYNNFYEISARIHNSLKAGDKKNWAVFYDRLQPEVLKNLPIVWTSPRFNVKPNDKLESVTILGHTHARLGDDNKLIVGLKNIHKRMSESEDLNVLRGKCEDLLNIGLSVRNVEVSDKEEAFIRKLILEKKISYIGIESMKLGYQNNKKDLPDIARDLNTLVSSLGIADGEKRVRNLLRYIYGNAAYYKIMGDPDFKDIEIIPIDNQKSNDEKIATTFVESLKNVVSLLDLRSKPVQEYWDKFMVSLGLPDCTILRELPKQEEREVFANAPELDRELKLAMRQMLGKYKDFYKYPIGERNKFMVDRIKELNGQVLVVVGLTHVNGIEGLLNDAGLKNTQSFYARDLAMLTLKRMEVNVGNQQALGGIDLTPANMNLNVRNGNGVIKFHMDPAMLQQLQNAPGFVPVIINIQPMVDLGAFLDSKSASASPIEIK